MYHRWPLLSHTVRMTKWARLGGVGSAQGLRELALTESLQQALPDVASFDPDTQRTVAQRPTRIMVHEQEAPEIVHLHVHGLRDALVTATPEHPVLVEKEGTQEWLRVGELQEGDTLVGPDGERYDVDTARTAHEYGAFTVYNMSFDEAVTEMVPTFVVCSPASAQACIAVHNK